jgi:hypothetical protein
LYVVNQSHQHFGGFLVCAIVYRPDSNAWRVLPDFVDNSIPKLQKPIDDQHGAFFARAVPVVLGRFAPLIAKPCKPNVIEHFLSDSRAKLNRITEPLAYFPESFLVSIVHVGISAEAE